MMYRETGYSALEAPLFALRNAWFFPSLDSLHRTALVTYDVFKVTCRSRGHTYLLHKYKIHVEISSYRLPVEGMSSQAH